MKLRTGRWAAVVAVALAISWAGGNAAETKPRKHRPPSGPAKAAANPVRERARYDVRFQQFRLDNGLRILLAEDHHAPTYSICMTYNVGSRDEKAGRTGFAHLFEHMLFQGSENVGKGEHFILVQSNGGSANGTTNSERTNYFETLPANQLELGIFLEADRMRAPNITQANFDNQRATVQEERRQNYDNRPYGKTYEAVIGLAYDRFPYQHSTIGSIEDLNAATIEDAKEFFRVYYAPNNAVLSLVGAFQTDIALGLIKKYFAPIPSQPLPARPDTREPEQSAERRRTIEDRFAQTPRLDAVYKIPPGNTPDWYALDMLGRVLSSGVSSRLYQKFVKEKEIALSVYADPSEQRGPSLFWFSLMARPQGDPAALERLLDEEIARVQAEPVAAWELDKIRMQLRRERAQRLYSSRSRATSLGHFAVYYGDPGLINTVWQNYERVSAADIQRVARRYLRRERRSVVITLPSGAGARESAP